MTTKDEIIIRQAAVRKELRELSAPESPTEDAQARMKVLSGELDTLEVRHIAALKSEEGVVEPEPSGDAEAVELRGLLDNANVGNIMHGVFTQKGARGVERELQEHFGIGQNEIPLSMLEERLVSTIPADASITPGQTNQQAVLQPVFATGDAAFMGVSMPRVPAGQQSYPVLTTRPTVGGLHTDSTSVAETNGAFSAEALEPGRLQASFFYRRTDAARFPQMGEALRAALSSGLSEALDKQTVDAIIADVGRTDTAGVDTYASYLTDLCYGRIDGRHATMPSELRVLLGTETMVHIASLYRSTNGGDDNGLQKLASLVAGVRVSAHIPVAVSNKQDALVRIGSRMDAVAPMWEGVTIINDEVTKAATGEIVITAVLMAAFNVHRVSGFARMETQRA